MIIPYPDVSMMEEHLAQAVCRMTRLVGQMRERHPDLDRFAIATETETDRYAAAVVARHVERLRLGFELMISPFDPGALPHGGAEPPLEGAAPSALGTRVRSGTRG